MVDTKFPAPLPKEIKERIENLKDRSDNRLRGFFKDIEKYGDHHQMQAQKEIFSYILYMDYLKAKSWRMAGMDERKEAITNQKFATDIGRMVAFDAFMGNLDRLTEGNFNPGNIMLYGDMIGNKNVYKIALVDNECNINTSLSNRIENNLHKLLSNKSMMVCSMLAKVLLEGKKGEFGALEPDDTYYDSIYANLSNWIHEGVQQGAEELLEILSDEEFLNETLKQIPESANIDTSLMTGLIIKLRSLVEKLAEVNMEPTNRSIANRCGCLELLKSNIGTSGPDQYNMIRAYFSETGIRTNVLFSFEKIADTLRSKSNPELHQKDVKMRERFMNLIDNHIAFLQQPQNAHEIDPWMELSFKVTDNKLKEKLQEVSYHIQDVLFACELAAEFEVLSVQGFRSCRS